MVNGILKRPTTPDTVLDWLKIKPHPGLCLAISNQPYVLYQDSVLKTVLPPSFTVETIGEKMDETSYNVSLLLDNLARFLYQEAKRLNVN